MRTDREALKLVAAILLRCVLVGTLFAGAAYFLKHAVPAVLIVVFAVPVAIGLIWAGVVLSSPRSNAPPPSNGSPR